MQYMTNLPTPTQTYLFTFLPIYLPARSIMINPMKAVKCEQLLAIEYPCNPEMEEPRCRICYLEQRPLIAMCLCSGSIQYVHEECVLEWITKKIEMADELEIPKCEICRSQYNAKLNVGQRKVCPDLLLNKLRELEIKEIAHAVVYLLGAVVALWVAVNAVFAQVSTLWQVYEGQETVSILQQMRGLKVVFTDFVFPFIFLRSGVKFFSNYRFLWEESEVQMVELVLTPRLILKD